jgi:hypothetical protein
MARIGFLKPGSYQCQPFRRKSNSKLTHLRVVVEDDDLLMVEIDSIYDDGLVGISYKGPNYLWRGEKKYGFPNPGLSLVVEASQMIIDERYEKLPTQTEYAHYVYRNPESGKYETFGERRPRIDYVRTLQNDFAKIYLRGYETVSLEDLTMVAEDDAKNNVILKEISKRTGMKIGQLYNDRNSGSLIGNILEIRGAFVTDIVVKDVEDFKRKFEALCMEHSLFPQLDITFDDSYLEDSLELDAPDLYCMALNMGINLEELFEEKKVVLLGSKFGL